MGEVFYNKLQKAKYETVNNIVSPIYKEFQGTDVEKLHTQFKKN